MKAALDRTTRRLDLPANTAPVERSAPTAAVPPGLSSGSAAIGLGKAEAKAKLEIGGDEQSALVQNLSRDLEQMIAQLTKLLASEAPTAQARAKAAARVKAGRAALATLPQASLDPALASALASIAAALPAFMRSCKVDTPAAHSGSYSERGVTAGFDGDKSTMP